MRLAVLKERRAYETRVAATPETVKKLTALGITLAIETGAGLASSISDADYVAAGAQIVPDAATALADAKVVFAVQTPEPAELAQIARGTLLVCTAGAAGNAEPARRGATLAVHSMLGYAGGFVGPLIVGWTLDLAGGMSPLAWGLAFAVVAVLMAAALAVFLAIRPRELEGDRGR